MSVEQTNRAKHKFDERLSKFIWIATGMSKKGLELAMGRVADQLSDAESEHERSENAIRQSTLKLILDMRFGSTPEGFFTRGQFLRQREEIKKNLKKWRSVIDENRRTDAIAQTEEKYTNTVEVAKAAHEGHLEVWNAECKVWQAKEKLAIAEQDGYDLRQLEIIAKWWKSAGLRRYFVRPPAELVDETLGPRPARFSQVRPIQPRYCPPEKETVGPTLVRDDEETLVVKLASLPLLPGEVSIDTDFSVDQPTVLRLALAQVDEY